MSKDLFESTYYPDGRTTRQPHFTNQPSHGPIPPTVMIIEETLRLGISGDILTVLTTLDRSKQP